MKEEYISHFADQDGQELWKELPKSEGEERAEILLELAQDAIYSSRGSKALALAEEAHEIYKSLGAAASSVDVANAYSLIAHSLIKLGKLDEAIMAIDRSIEALRESHFPFVGDVLREKALWLADAQRYEEALKVYLEIATLHEIEGDNEFLSYTLTSVAYCYLSLGQWEEVIAHSERAIEVAKAHKRVDLVGWNYIYMAEAYAESGNADLALDIGRKALDLAEIRNSGQMKCRASIILGRASAWKADFPSAESHLQLARDLATTSTDWETVKKIERDFIKLYLVQGRTEDAAEIERQLRTLEDIV